jgi:hypothetical protein
MAAHSDDLSVGVFARPSNTRTTLSPRTSARSTATLWRHAVRPKFTDGYVDLVVKEAGCGTNHAGIGRKVSLCRSGSSLPALRLESLSSPACLLRLTHEAVPVQAAPAPVASMQPAFVVVLPFAQVAPIAEQPSTAAGPPIAAAPTPTEVWAVPWEPPPSAPPPTVLSPLRTTAANVDMPRIRLAIERGLAVPHPAVDRRGLRSGKHPFLNFTFWSVSLNAAR